VEKKIEIEPWREDKTPPDEWSGLVYFYFTIQPRIPLTRLEIIVEYTDGAIGREFYDKNWIKEAAAAGFFTIKENLNGKTARIIKLNFTSGQDSYVGEVFADPHWAYVLKFK
jgi:hypothetical protein